MGGGRTPEVGKRERERVFVFEDEILFFVFFSKKLYIHLFT